MDMLSLVALPWRITVVSSHHVSDSLRLSPHPAPHVLLVEPLGDLDRLSDMMLFGVFRRAMLVAECFQNHAAIQNCQCTGCGLHLEVELSPSGAGDMECLVAVLIATLNARTHPLVADVALKFPPGSWDLLDFHDGLHERVVA